MTLRSQAGRDFLARFPESVLARAGSLPERHWHLITLLARVPGADELAEGNLALTHAIASSWAFRSGPDAQPYRTGRRIVRLRRAQIAEWLGFQGRNAVVRVLAKVRPGAVSVRRLLYLRQTLSLEPIPKALLHLPSLDRCVLRIVTDPQLLSRVTHTFLDQVSNDPAEVGLERLAYMLGDTVGMAGDLAVRLGLCLRSDRDGWELEQIKGLANAPVEHETVQQVQAWLGSIQ